MVVMVYLGAGASLVADSRNTHSSVSSELVESVQSQDSLSRARRVFLKPVKSIHSQKSLLAGSSLGICSDIISTQSIGVCVLWELPSCTQYVQLQCWGSFKNYITLFLIQSPQRSGKWYFHSFNIISRYTLYLNRYRSQIMLTKICLVIPYCRAQRNTE